MYSSPIEQEKKLRRKIQIRCGDPKSLETLGICVTVRIGGDPCPRRRSRVFQNLLDNSFLIICDLIYNEYSSAFI